MENSDWFSIIAIIFLPMVMDIHIFIKTLHQRKVISMCIVQQQNKICIQKAATVNPQCAGAPSNWKIIFGSQVS